MVQPEILDVSAASLVQRRVAFFPLTLPFPVHVRFPSFSYFKIDCGLRMGGSETGLNQSEPKATMHPESLLTCDHYTSLKHKRFEPIEPIEFNDASIISYRDLGQNYRSNSSHFKMKNGNHYPISVQSILIRKQIIKAHEKPRCPSWCRNVESYSKELSHSSPSTTCSHLQSLQS